MKVAKGWRLSRQATPDLGDLSLDNVGCHGECLETGKPVGDFFLFGVNKRNLTAKWDGYL